MMYGTDGSTLVAPAEPRKLAPIPEPEPKFTLALVNESKDPDYLEKAIRLTQGPKNHTIADAAVRRLIYLAKNPK